MCSEFQKEIQARSNHRSSYKNHGSLMESHSKWLQPNTQLRSNSLYLNKPLCIVPGASGTEFSP